MVVWNLSGRSFLRAMPPSLVRRWKTLAFRSPLNIPCRERETSVESTFFFAGQDAVFGLHFQGV